MGQFISLTSGDGFELDAYRADPEGTPKGAILVIQEIFGVNIHIREVCDGYANDGYVTVAPALFDRVEKNIELGYEGADMTRGVDIARGKLQPANTMADITAGIQYLQDIGKVGVVGYCFGGLMTWLCACNTSGIAAASSYYGGGIGGVADQVPKVPTILHFGDQDAHIPMSDVDNVKNAHPDVGVYVYAADHGFNCDHRASFNEAAATLARSRTISFFNEHLGS